MWRSSGVGGTATTKADVNWVVINDTTGVGAVAGGADDPQPTQTTTIIAA
jgi:hypothetical protein